MDSLNRDDDFSVCTVGLNEPPIIHGEYIDTAVSDYETERLKGDIVVNHRLAMELYRCYNSIAVKINTTNLSEKALEVQLELYLLNRDPAEGEPFQLSDYMWWSQEISFVLKPGETIESISSRNPAAQILPQLKKYELYLRTIKEWAGPELPNPKCFPFEGIYEQGPIPPKEDFSISYTSRRCEDLVRRGQVRAEAHVFFHQPDQISQFYADEKVYVVLIWLGASGAPIDTQRKKPSETFFNTNPEVRGFTFWIGFK